MTGMSKAGSILKTAVLRLLALAVVAAIGYGG